MSAGPIIYWLRRDLRLTDHAGLAEAAATGRAVIPVYIRDAAVDDLGAAAKWRLGQSIEAFSARLENIGSRLVLRSGPASDVLDRLIMETGASSVWWSRLYDPFSVARDKKIKTALRRLDVRSFTSHLLFEPWDVATGEGGYYKVYSPFWRAVRGRSVASPLPEVTKLAPPHAWTHSERLADWALGAAMNRGASVVLPHQAVGEARALSRLETFLDGPVHDYRQRRDFPAEPATSRLSENLTYGEISPRVIWHAGLRAQEGGAAGAEHFLKELVWREFAAALLFHTPHIATSNWRDGWDAFGWRGENEDADRWRQGRTGEPLVDAAMREMYVTGTMHNRARMIAASYLTKHLLTDWRVGQKWFAECLTDWDPASNAMGWQWVAGSGPDAAPYFRVFNPATQAQKFDPDSVYRRRWIAEGHAHPSETSLEFFKAIPRSWNLSPKSAYPEPVIGLAAGRERALAAYSRSRG